MTRCFLLGDSEQKGTANIRMRAVPDFKEPKVIKTTDSKLTELFWALLFLLQFLSW
jgi:hypothetical protein